MFYRRNIPSGKHPQTGNLELATVASRPPHSPFPVLDLYLNQSELLVRLRFVVVALWQTAFLEVDHFYTTDFIGFFRERTKL